jgi:hypothetical protein
LSQSSESIKKYVNKHSLRRQGTTQIKEEEKYTKQNRKRVLFMEGREE